MFNDIPVVTRGERLDKTIIVLKRSDMPLPLRVLCERQGMKVTPYMREVVQTLIYDGHVTSEMRQANGFQVAFYSLTDAGRVFAEKVVSVYDEPA